MASIDLNTPIRYLKGVGPVRAEALADTGINTVEDFIYYFPRRHLDRTSITPIRSLQKDTTVTVVGVVEACGERKTRKRRLFQAILSDGTGILTLTWFNGIHYVNKALKIGDRLAVNGRVEFFNGYQIVHPEFDSISGDDDPLNTGSIIPLYPLTQQLKATGLEQVQFRKLIRQIFNSLADIPEILPSSSLKSFQLTGLKDALHNIHFAGDEGVLMEAIRRLKFDEHFFLQLLMALRRETAHSTITKALDQLGPYVQMIYDELDFELTDAQKRVLKEIRTDLGKSVTMNRLLQGDVGSGKTVVAILAAAIAVGNGVQVAVMAPTEILAHQHYKTFRYYTDKAKMTCSLLVGNLKTAERKKLLAGLKEGRIQIVVGTHALIQKDVEFQHLGLVVVDEQHRFGVVQRGDLISKGFSPHFLAMTATPIPRTLAITYHGDMDLSLIDELPRNRLPVLTRLVDPERLSKVYQFIREEVEKGRQCMIVYPLVEETEKSDLAAAVEAHEILSKREFPELKMGLIHGRMKKEEKDAVMDAYARNQIHVLVSTTVIEVGIDVPNATVMLIEHADRFGLTQLHQLRGRVGRGEEKSYCILVQRKYTPTARKRLEIMARSNDGFVISDEDLKIRGPGEFFGIRQSGFLRYKIADLVTDGPIIRDARKAAFDLVAEDPHLRKPSHSLIRQRFLSDYQDKLELVNIS